MITMQPLNHLQADESEYPAYTSFVNILRAERTPDLPPIPQAEQVNRLQNVPPFMGYSIWTLTADDGRIIAALELARPQTEENRHLAQWMIQVLPEQRRRGYGRTLLQQAAHLAQAGGRRLVERPCGGSSSLARPPCQHPPPVPSPTL